MNVREAGEAAVSVDVIIIGFTIRATGWHWLDPAVSILIGAVIVWGTWSSLRESINLALAAVPEAIDLQAVEAYLAALSGVRTVHDLHIWGMSTTDVALTAHLVMPAPPTGDKFLNDVVHTLQESSASAMFRFRSSMVT